MEKKITGDKKRTVCFVGILALLFTVMQIAGWQISMKYGTSVHQSAFAQKIGVLSGIQCCIVGLVEWAVWYALLGKLYRLADQQRDYGIAAIEPVKRTRLQNAVIVLGLAGLLLICWLPAFFACYPGFYNYDIRGQLPQVMYEEVGYNSHHPLLHTLFSGFLLTWGYQLAGNDLSGGVVFHSLCQMAICAVFFSHFVRKIYDLTQTKWLAVVAFLYYAFFPTIVMFCMSTTKDVLCAVFLSQSVLDLYEMIRGCRKPGITQILRFVVTTTLTCMFRYNIVCTVLVLAVLMLCRGRKYYLPSAILAISCVGCLGCNCLLQNALHAESGSAAEAFSVPIQQLARLYCEEGADAFTDEELHLVSAAVSLEQLEQYSPVLADCVKNYVDFDVIGENALQYLCLWLRKGVQYPGTYLQAFLDNTYQAWYPGTSIVDDTATGHIYYFDYDGCEPVERDSRIPWLGEFYRWIAQEFFYQKIPVVRLLFSIGAMLWLAILVWGYGLLRRSSETIWAMSYVLLVCGTAMLGPIALVRYYLILFFLAPVCVGFFLGHGRNASRT